MFKFSPSKSTADPCHTVTLWLTAAFIGTVSLAGCQQQPEPTMPDSESQVSTQTDVEASKPTPQSDSAAARIEQFQPLYVSHVQGLQRRLQAEYESLEAADTSDSENALLLNDATDNKITTDSEKDNAADTSRATNPTSESDNNTSIDANINTSTEVGERDLTVLKRISLEPHKPTMLTEEQIIDSYQQALQALYQPVTTVLSAQNTDTLLNIATLIPQLFEHAEIAGRVTAKSPALARLIIQHQVWEQIEAQQVLDMQKMKQTQQQEFEMLMLKFNDTIKDYDEQIAKYEQTLKEFQ